MQECIDQFIGILPGCNPCPGPFVAEVSWVCVPDMEIFLVVQERDLAWAVDFIPAARLS